MEKKKGSRAKSPRRKEGRDNAGMLKQYGLNAKGGVLYEDVEVGVC